MMFTTGCHHESELCDEGSGQSPYPEKFTPFANQTDDPVHNEWTSKANGNAQKRFMKGFRRRYM